MSFFFYRLLFPLRFWKNLLFTRDSRVKDLRNFLSFGIVFSALCIAVVGLWAALLELSPSDGLTSSAFLLSLLCILLCGLSLARLPRENTTILSEDERTQRIYGPYRIAAGLVGIGGAWIMFNLLLAVFLSYGALLAVLLSFFIFLFSIAEGWSVAIEKVTTVWETLTFPKHFYYAQIELFESWGLGRDEFFIASFANLLFVFLIMLILSGLILRRLPKRAAA